MANNIAIRLGVEGGPDVRRAFDEAGNAGKTAFDGVAVSMDKAGAAGDRLAQKIREAGTAAREAQNAAGGRGGASPAPTPSPAVSKEIERLRFQLDEEYRKGSQLGTAEDKIDRGLGAGYLGASEAARLRTLAAERYGGGNDNDPSRRGLSTYDQQFVRYQAFDVASTLGSGGSLTTAAFQQGPQLLQQLADRDGGLKTGLKELGVTALGLVNPMTIAGTAVAGLGIAIGVAASQASKDREVLEATTRGIGAGTGATVSQLDALARGNAELGKVSTSTSREIVAQYASLGSLAVPVIDSLTRSTSDYARITGTDAVSAATDLARAVADGGSALETVASRLGGLSDATLQLIQVQREQGDRSGAQQTAADALKASIDANAIATTGWAGAWNTATAAANGYWEAAKHIAGIKLGVAPEGAAEAVTRLQQQVDAANKMRAFSGLSPLNPKDSQQARELEVAKVIADQDRMIAEGKAAEARAIAASTAAGTVARQVDPNFARLSQLREQQTALRDALADPLARNKLADEGQAEAAYTATTRAITTLTDASGRMISMEEMSRRQDQLKIDSLNAKTDAEKKSVAERQKAFDLIGKTLTPSDARGQIDRAGVMSGLESASKGGGGKSASENADEYDRGLKSIEDRIRRQGEEATTFGMGADAVARYRTEQELLTAAKRADRDVSATLTDQIKDYAEKAAQAAQRMEQLRESMKTIDSVRSMGSDGLRSIIGDLTKGASAADLMRNASSRLLTSISNMASDQIAEGFFGKRGSSAGWLADLFGAGGSGANSLAAGAQGPSFESGGALAFIKSLFGGFDKGGYTGPGGRLEAAGVVHKGEYVFDARTVDRIGVSTLEAMHKGRRGYADGGLVDPGNSLRPQRDQFTNPLAAMRAASAGAAPVFQTTIINNAPVQVETREVPDGRGGKRQEVIINEMVARGIESAPGQLALRRPRVATR